MTLVGWLQAALFFALYGLGALAFFKEYYRKNKAFIDGFSQFPSNHLSLVRKDGALDLYHGVMRAVDRCGHAHEE